MSSKFYRIKLNEKVYEVEVAEIQPGQAADAAVPKTPSEQAVTGEGEIISAPMPGTIVNVSAVKGSKVRSGQTIAVLEAMKMENEIVAPIDGTISEVYVQKGQSVNAGDKLLEIR